MVIDIWIIIKALAVASIFIYLLSKVDLKVGTFILSLLILFTFIYFAKLYPVIQAKTFNSAALFDIGGIKFLTFRIDLAKWYFLIIGLFIVLMASIFAISGNKDIKYGPSFNFFLIFITISIIGVFLSRNLITLYIFWELMTWTSFFMISMGKKDSKKAALFYLFLSMISAYFMLTGIFKLEAGLKSKTDFIKVLIYFIIAAFIKGGVYPLHVWLRPAHGNAPNVFSSILSGFLIKYGSYIFYLILLLTPTFHILKNNSIIIKGIPSFYYIIALFGGFSIIVGTIAAIAQEDVKYLIAFSSVSHAGYILLGLAYYGTYATAGGLMHIMVHALTAAGMFLSMAAVYSVTGTTKMSEMGGLIKKMPVTFTTYLVAIISVAGIPPMAGFISKWLIYQELIKRGDVILGFAAFFGSIGSFMYVFRPLATVFLGQLPVKYNNAKEVSFFMQLPMILISALTVFFGIFPHYALQIIAGIQKTLGIKPIQTSMYAIMTSLTKLEPFLITAVFTGGFIIAFILYFIFSKTTKVHQWEQYTAGEIVPELQTMPEIYHYAKNFYRPFERMFKKFIPLEKIYLDIAENFNQFFKYIKETIFETNTTVLIWITMLSILSIVIYYFIKLL